MSTRLSGKVLGYVLNHLIKNTWGAVFVCYKCIYLFKGGKWAEDSTSDVLIIDAKDGIEFIGNGPSMNEARGYSTCGLFNSNKHNGRPVIVVAGFHNTPDDESLLVEFEWTKTCYTSL